MKWKLYVYSVIKSEWGKAKAKRLKGKESCVGQNANTLETWEWERVYLWIFQKKKNQ